MNQATGTISKISRPRLGSVFNRTRLFDLIEKYREYPVTWLSGGPGAGKTTLAASYIKSKDVPCIWYQMDRADADPATFFHFMTLAVSRVLGSKAGTLPRLSPENHLNLPLYSIHYFRDLFAQMQKPLVMVLDNYHEIPDDSVIHELLNAGLQQIPVCLNVLILSRTPPPPEMTRLLVNRVLKTIPPQALSLTDEEIVGIASLADKWKACPETVAAISEIIDGWTAGLVLMLECISPGEETPFASKEMAKDLFFNYFAGEMFTKMAPGVQDFLLKVAILPAFTPQTAEKITGFKEAAGVLADMNRKNYFTEKKIDNGAFYQFHPLFREFLVSKAKALFAGERLNEIYRQAADMLARQGQPEDAFPMYAKAGDRTAQVDLIYHHADAFLTQGRMGIVESWLKGLPVDIFRSDPQLLYLYGQCRLPFDLKQSRDAFIQAHRLFKTKQAYPELVLTISGIIETIVTELGHFKHLDPWIEELDHLLGTFKIPLSPEIEARAVFALFSALMFRQPHHPKMKPMETRMFDLLRAEGDKPLRVMAATYLAHYHCWTGDIHKTSIIIEIMLELMKSAELSPLVFMTAKMSEAVYRWFMADADGSLAAVDQGLEEAEKSGVHIIDNWLLAQAVYTRLTLDDPGLAKPILDRMKPIINSSRYLDISHYQSLLSIFHLETGSVDLAFRHGKEALRSAMEAGSPFPEALNCIIAAQISFEKSDEKKARTFNRRAREIAHSMHSDLLYMLSLFNQARFDLKAGKHAQVREALKIAFHIRKSMGITNFSLWRRKWMMDLYEEALRSGIEVAYIRDLIKTRKLLPRTSSIDIENWPWRIRIYTLGRFELVIDDQPLHCSGKPQVKPLEVLKVLIALGGKNVSMNQLQDLLWPDAEGDKARRTLITTLFRLRKLLGDEKAILTGDSRMSINDRHCWLDVWALETFCNRTETKITKTTPATGEISAMAENLLILYRGDFIKNEDDFPWAMSPRVKHQSKFLRTLSLLAKTLENQDQYEPAVDLYLRGLDVDELAEPLYQGLMCCYQKQGRIAECVSTYERCRDTLSSVLGTAPSRATESIRRTLGQ